MNSILSSNMVKIQELCRKHHVLRLYAFGSVVRDDFREDSDVDLLVRFALEDLLDPLDYGENYLNLLVAFEETLKRPIDLVSAKSVTNPFFIQELNNTIVQLYG